MAARKKRVTAAEAAGPCGVCAGKGTFTMPRSDEPDDRREPWIIPCSRCYKAPPKSKIEASVETPAEPTTESPNSGTEEDV